MNRKRRQEWKIKEISIIYSIIVFMMARESVQTYSLKDVIFIAHGVRIRNQLTGRGSSLLWHTNVPSVACALQNVPTRR